MNYTKSHVPNHFETSCDSILDWLEERLHSEITVYFVDVILARFSRDQHDTTAYYDIFTAAIIAKVDGCNVRGIFEIEKSVREKPIIRNSAVILPKGVYNLLFTLTISETENRQLKESSLFIDHQRLVYKSYLKAAHSEALEKIRKKMAERRLPASPVKHIHHAKT